MPPSSASAQSSSEAPIITGTSWRMSCALTTSGATSAETPRMNSTLKMLLPTTLPMAMSTWPVCADCTETAISGALVPKATIVSPTTSGDTPKEMAIREAPRTRDSAPTTSRTRPRKNQANCTNMMVTIRKAAHARRPAPARRRRLGTQAWR